MVRQTSLRITASTCISGLSNVSWHIVSSQVYGKCGLVMMESSVQTLHISELHDSMDTDHVDLHGGEGRM